MTVWVGHAPKGAAIVTRRLSRHPLLQSLLRKHWRARALSGMGNRRGASHRPIPGLRGGEAQPCIPKPMEGSGKTTFTAVSRADRPGRSDDLCRPGPRAERRSLVMRSPDELAGPVTHARHGRAASGGRSRAYRDGVLTCRPGHDREPGRRLRQDPHTIETGVCATRHRARGALCHGQP